MKKLKSFTVHLIAMVNLAVVGVMLFVGYSDRINPAYHPMLACVGMAFPVLLLLNLLFLFFWLTVKWRKAWIPIVGYLLACVPINIFMPLNIHADTTPGALKLISYNVCTYGGNYKYDDGFETVLGYLAEQQADIVCIQEDNDTWRRYVFQRYEAYYPYNDTTRVSVSEKVPNYVGLHSRFPIIRKERIEYESRCNGSVAYYLDLGTDTLLVINNHLESTHLNAADRSNYQTMLRGNMGRDTVRTESKALLHKLANAMTIRAPQAEAVSQYIRAHSHYPIIVCGDFNDTPISYARRTIGQGLTDCFQAAGLGVGLSYNQKGFNFRIDHIFCSSNITPQKCIVDSKMDASDHYPMVCWLKMSDKP